MLPETLQKKLKCCHSALQARERVIVKKGCNNEITLKNKKCLNFTSNDYLGLSAHPSIIESFINGVKEYGFGSGSSNTVSGYCEAQQALETRFSEWLQVDKALLFNSGYLANIGVIGALADRFDIILSDKYCHASLLDGVQLSRAKHYRYKHNSITDLSRLIVKKEPTLIVTESVFSMEGDIAPVKKITQLTSKHNVGLVIDDAHGIGVLGAGGRGICEHAAITQSDITCLIVPLGKALNGMGAIVAGQKKVIEALVQFSRSYRYTTAMPPAVCSGLMAALDIVQKEKWRRGALLEVIHFFNQQAEKSGLILNSHDLTPIRTIVIGANNRVMQLQKRILEHGFYVSEIRPPTVPSGTGRLRISLNCLHTKQQIVRLLACINGYIQ